MRDDDVLGAALQVVLDHIPPPGNKTLCVVVTADDGTTGAVLASWTPSVVRLVNALNGGADVSGLRPEERWVQTNEGYAKRVDALEVTRWYGVPSADFAALFPDLRDGDRQRRVPLKAKSIEAARLEADEHFPLSAWWSEVLEQNKRGGKG